MTDILNQNNQDIVQEIITASTYKPRQSCILFGVTEDDRIREEVERKIGEGLKEIRSLQYMSMREYRENYTEFLPALRELSERESCFIFVRGLDDLISLDISLNRMVGSRPLILNYLNMNREFFLAYPVHILFWISPETERMLFDLAPDLWAFRTHSHFFDEIVREEPPDLSSLKIIELVPYEGKRENLERDIEIKEKLLLKFLAEDGAKLSYQALGLLKELAVRYYLKSDYGKAQVYAEKVVEGKTESGREGEEKNDPELLNILGLCYGRNKESGKAVELLEKALKAAEEKYIYRDWKGVLLNNLGVVSYWKEDWEKAGDYFDKALENIPAPEKPEDGKGRESGGSGEGGSYNESRDKYNRIFILSNRGTVLFREMKLEEAGERYFQAVITIYITVSEPDSGRYLSSFEYHDRSDVREIARDLEMNIIDSRFLRRNKSELSFLSLSGIADFLFNWGVLLYTEGNLDKSSTLLSLTIKLYNLCGNKKSANRTLLWIVSKKNWKELHLNNLKFYSLSLLPPEIGNLGNLRELRLYNNQLSAIPPEIGNLRNLNNLDLQNNQLSTIPPEIGNLENLNELYLSVNQLSAITPEIGNLGNLKRLGLNSNHQLSAIPPEIGNLRNLEELDLIDNRLSAIPPEIGNLGNLKRLGLNSNQLSTIPPEIGNLRNLEELHLINNRLSAIPPEIGNLRSLEKLALSRNRLSAIPPEIGSLENLNELYLRVNQLSAIPPEIGNLRNLEKLDLENNQLSVIPPEIGNLGNLKKLWLNSNELSAISPEIGNLRSLEELVLNNNQLSSIPPEIGNLGNLKRLYLMYNQLSAIPPEIKKLKNLSFLDLRNNPLPIPDEILAKTDSPSEILDYYFNKSNG